jgi:hypothetical protein
VSVNVKLYEVATVGERVYDAVACVPEATRVFDDVYRDHEYCPVPPVTVEVRVID